MRYFHTELFSRFLPSAHSGHVNLAATKPCQVGSSCQSTEMATLLNQYISCLKFRFCQSVVSYNYFDYTVKWCSLINCMVCMAGYSVHFGFKFAGNVKLIQVSRAKSQSNLAGQNGIPGVL